LFCVNGVLLLMWSLDGYDKFCKIMCCAFIWCSTILLKSFMYLFIYFLLKVLVLQRHALHHFSLLTGVVLYWLYYLIFCSPLWYQVCIKCVLVISKYVKSFLSKLHAFQLKMCCFIDRVGILVCSALLFFNPYITVLPNFPCYKLSPSPYFKFDDYK
jgi:hypothetical protein